MELVEWAKLSAVVNFPDLAGVEWKSECLLMRATLGRAKGYL